MYIPIIAGATGTGKTKISIELAKKINGEIISADSMQVYKDMNIGTAKADDEEMENIPHYMLSNIDPLQNYSVAQYISAVENKIYEIYKKNKIPIIVGGTGLYINTLIYGIRHGGTFDQTLRDKLNKEAEDPEKLKKLYEKAVEIDSEAMEKISPNDVKRILRIIEIYENTGKTKTEIEEENRISKEERKYKFKIFALSLPRDFQYEVLNKRVDKMLEQGLLEENIYIYNKYFKEEFNNSNIYLPKSIEELEEKQFKKEQNLKTDENVFKIDEKELKIKEEFINKLRNKYTSMQAIGYKEILKYILGLESYNEAIEKLKQGTRKYAKRQYTWFKKNDAIWIDMYPIHTSSGEKQLEEINKVVEKITEEIEIDS